MDVIFYLFIALVALFAVLTSIAIWSPRAAWIRIVAIVIAAAVLPLSYAVLAGLLSKPKPRSFAWFEARTEKAELLGASFAEGKAIYLWLKLDQMVEPRYFVLPWRKQLAQKLEEVMEAATKTRAGVLIIKPFDDDPYAQSGSLNIKIVPPRTQPKKLPRFPQPAYDPRGGTDT
jgi:hypothetical protein